MKQANNGGIFFDAQKRNIGLLIPRNIVKALST